MDTSCGRAWPTDAPSATRRHFDFAQHRRVDPPRPTQHDEDQPMKIVASVLVQNEDIHIQWALENILEFCDRVIITDHQSSDGTLDILKRMAATSDRIELHQIQDAAESHEFLRPYAGTDTWIFGVDGDEIYDPVGLRQMRTRLGQGEFKDWWVVFGNVLNCTAIDREAKQATGHLAPPSRSMTKLHNFAHLEDWPDVTNHRLSGGNPIFKPGRSLDRRLDLYKTLAWEEAYFRCLHTCFMQRSSLEPAHASDALVSRENISEKKFKGPLERFRSWVKRQIGVEHASKWKMEKYARGPAVTLDISSFM